MKSDAPNAQRRSNPSQLRISVTTARALVGARTGEIEAGSIDKPTKAKKHGGEQIPHRPEETVRSLGGWSRQHNPDEQSRDRGAYPEDLGGARDQDRHAKDGEQQSLIRAAEDEPADSTQ
ncbi:MAG: hypothetical protein M3346_02620 [Actinomycetota bacterium]|nr:hypothetical protein [Actinomycetota bacterium]